jgi:hypothetical protein
MTLGAKLITIRDNSGSIIDDTRSKIDDHKRHSNLWHHY